MGYGGSIMGLTYFVTDDNYGLSTGILALDVSSFTEEDWGVVSAAADSERVNVILSIYNAKELS
jgi:hypothetical protein